MHHHLHFVSKMDLMLDNQFLMFIFIFFLGKMVIMKTMMTYMMR